MTDSNPRFCQSVIRLYPICYTNLPGNERIQETWSSRGRNYLQMSEGSRRFRGGVRQLVELLDGVHDPAITKFLLPGFPIDRLEVAILSISRGRNAGSLITIGVDRESGFLWVSDVLTSRDPINVDSLESALMQWCILPVK